MLLFFMIKLIFIALFLTTNIYSQSSTTRTNRILLLNSQKELMSGRYTFDDNSQIYATFVPFNYHLAKVNHKYIYTLKGAIGLGKEIEPHKKNDFYSLKLGLNLTQKIYKDLHLSTQVDILYNNQEGKSSRYYGLKANFLYQPTIAEYKPYIKIGVGTFSTQNVKNIYDIQSALLRKIEVGLVTPQLTSIYSMPIRFEPFFLMARMSRSIKEQTGTKRYYKIGLNSYFGSSALFDWIDDATFIKKDYLGWIDEITFETSYIHGNNFHGFNIGFGINF